MEDNSHDKGFLNFVSDIFGVGIKENISKDRMSVFRDLFKKENFNQFIWEMKEDMNLKTRIFFKFHPDSELISRIKGNPFLAEILGTYKEYNIPFDRHKEPATIRFSEPLLFGTESFENHRFELLIGETMKYESVESFIYLLAHELSHIVLHSIKHPLRHSEVATDICAIILGYGDVMRKGRILSGNVRLGYLTDEQFEIAYEFIDQKRTGYVEIIDNGSFLDTVRNVVRNFGNKFVPEKN